MASGVDAVHGGLHEVVDRLGVQRPGQDPVALADRAQHRPVGDLGGAEPGAQGDDRAAATVAGAGQDDEFDLFAVLVGLRAGQGEDQAAVLWWVIGRR